MLNYQEIGGSELAKIITDRETVVINVAQYITNTVKQPHNEWFEVSIPILPSEELNRVIATTIIDGDEKTVWNAFILSAYNLGAYIRFKNTNDVDCLVEISF